MFCSKCGKEIRDNSSFCPACGAQIMGNQTAFDNAMNNETRQIILRRPSMYGGAYVFHILLDGGYVDKLGPHQTVTLTVSSNSVHQIEFSSNGHGASYPINIQPGRDDLVFDVSYTLKGINIEQTGGTPISPVAKKTKSGGCYVATCVYGSYDCPQVWTLRRYRDDTLASTWYGRTFIRTYYAVSPTLVAWFGHTDWFKKLWRGKLDRMVDALQKDGVEDTPYDDKPW